MAFADATRRATPAIAEINIIPLCDVLLVLLIIFMVTAPALSQQIDAPLPPPAPIDLRIDAAGQLAWNGSAIDRAALPARMRDAIGGGRQPLLRIEADGDCDYQAVATVLATARNAGLSNIGFVRQ
jgi:biopolymer transport protein ExbD